MRRKNEVTLNLLFNLDGGALRKNKRVSEHLFIRQCQKASQQHQAGDLEIQLTNSIEPAHQSNIK